VETGNYPFDSALEYRTAGLAAERAFWCQGVGLRVVLDEPDYIVLAREGSDFRLALKRDPAARPELSVQFRVEDLATAVAALAARGLAPQAPPQAYSAEHPGILTAAYKTPAGVSFRLWQFARAP
jgi:hypothetical protein